MPLMTKGNGNASQYFCNRRNIIDSVDALKKWKKNEGNEKKSF
jgi:hypothetical protein